MLYTLADEAMRPTSAIPKDPAHPYTPGPGRVLGYVGEEGTAASSEAFLALASLIPTHVGGG